MNFIKILLWASLLLSLYVSNCHCNAKPEGEESQDEISDDYLQHLDINAEIIKDLNNFGRIKKGSERDVKVTTRKKIISHDESAPAQSENDIGSAVIMEGGRPVRTTPHDRPLTTSDAKVREAPSDKKSFSSDDSAPALSESFKGSIINMEGGNLLKSAPAAASDAVVDEAEIEQEDRDPENVNSPPKNLPESIKKEEPLAPGNKKDDSYVAALAKVSQVITKDAVRLSSDDSAPALSESIKGSVINVEGELLKPAPAAASGAVVDGAEIEQEDHDQENVNFLPKNLPEAIKKEESLAPGTKNDDSYVAPLAKVSQVIAKDAVRLSSDDSAPALSENIKGSVINLEGVRSNLLKPAPAAASDVVLGEAEIEQEDHNQENVNFLPKYLPEAIKKEEPLAPENKKNDSYVAPLAKVSEVITTDAVQAEKQVESKPHPFALFTIANTNTGINYAQLPYREKYQWQYKAAPCHSFLLKIPDELAEKSMIKLCIFRPNLEFPDETNLFLLNENGNDKNSQQTVMGYVVNSNGSLVYGRIEDGMFYGEVSILDQEKNLPTIFVIEDFNLLNRLMRYNPKTLRHMLMVMQAPDKSNEHTHAKPSPLVYNAVVTKGASLISFMTHNRAADVNRNSFLMFTTSHNSYIISGEPLMKVDDQGVIRLESGKNNILVENDGSIKLNIPDKEYTFRPHGRTIIKEGMGVRTLQEHEGSVAITAYSSSSTYDCVLPTPALQPKRKGGYLCKVCLAWDDTFKKYYVEKMVPKDDADLGQHYLGRIIDRVSWIFRSIDLDGDTHPENIGLDYEDHSLHWTYPDIGGEDVNEQDIEVLFQSLEAYSFADCCLGIGFTMKNFPKDVLGKRTQAKSGPSGVCAGRTGRVANNLIIISANSKRGSYSRITEDQLIYATAHQIAGAFGAKPDGTGNDLCDQFVDEQQNTRHHLMWPDLMRNTTLREQSLSSCSKTDIMQVLTTCRSSCFDIDQHPFCGNGIVEGGEECDCGSEVNCLAQTCCYSRGGTYPCRKTGMGCTSGSASFYSTGIMSYMGTLILALMRHLLTP